MDKDTFLRLQPRLAKLFTNSRKRDRLSHAYLLYGDANAPLYDSAMYMAQSLFCENELLGCGECHGCVQFINDKHSDFTFIDGRNKNIKKEDINLLADKYALGTIEKGHTACYVISGIEHITEEAANALLKFLEEPSLSLVAILTTTNIESCLPTIVSRCITVKVESLTLDELLGDHPEDYSKEQAYALSLFASDSQKMKDLAHDDDFINAFQVAETFVGDMISSLDKAGYSLIKDGVELLKSSQALVYFNSIMIKIFSEALADNHDGPFGSMIIGLKGYLDKLPNSIEVLEDITMTMSANMNLTLSLSRFIASLA